MRCARPGGRGSTSISAITRSRPSIARGGFLPAAHAVHGVTHLAALCRLLAERDPHAAIYDALEAILDHLDDPRLAAPMIARFELDFLAELGFGLDLATCAATGATADLIYVSPKSGRAVSRAAGEAYRDKLMRLPAFLAQRAPNRNRRPISPMPSRSPDFFSIATLSRRAASRCRRRARISSALPTVRKAGSASASIVNRGLSAVHPLFTAAQPR